MFYGVTCHLPLSPLPQVYTALSAIGGGGGGEKERREGGVEEEERRRGEKEERRRGDVATIKQELLCLLVMTTTWLDPHASSAVSNSSKPSTILGCSDKNM